MKQLNFLNDLNPVQFDAVTSTEGPYLIIAGAGSGKTRVLTYRIAYLVEVKGVHPASILAIAFTNKAAEEMRERIEKLIGEKAKHVWISTFHAACARILRQEIGALGYSRNFVVYDERDSQKLIADILKELGFDPQEFRPAAIQTKISLAKSELISPNEFKFLTMTRLDEVVAAVYEKYQQKLKENAALDFDDILVLTVRLFREYPDILYRYQQRFRYILVDEYQDTNRTQYELLKLLAGLHRNVFVVGDDDQSVYGWRGADIRNILEFEKDFPEATVMRLEQNYRSTQVILEAANHLISHNRKRKGKTLWTENERGEEIALYEAYNEFDEAEYVASEITRLVSSKRYSYGDIAVFYRINAQSRVFEEVFVRYGIPYVIVGGLKFYDRQEIKDILAYLRLVINPDDSLSFKRVVNVPRRGIGKQTLEKLEFFAYQRGLNLVAALDHVDEIPGISAPARKGLKSLANFLAELKKVSQNKELPEIIWFAAEKSGYLEMLKNEKTVEADSRIENIQELVIMAVTFSKNYPGATLSNFLERMALIADIDTYQQGEEAVTLMTVHNAKGLEFPVVFIVGLEEGLFPHQRSMNTDDEIEEERRLCYVGITRAKEKLYLTYAFSRTRFGDVKYQAPSRFLSEIPKELIYVERKGTGVEIGSRFKDDLLFRSEFDKYSDRHLSPADLAPGDMVFHASFGKGVVIEVGGAGRIVVNFDQVGEKTLLLDYAPLKKMDSGG
jgi:DNA helicase-2/ATP-dependent DNA helicase PcrA